MHPAPPPIPSTWGFGSLILPDDLFVHPFSTFGVIVVSHSSTIFIRSLSLSWPPVAGLTLGTALIYNTIEYWMSWAVPEVLVLSELSISLLDVMVIGGIVDIIIRRMTILKNISWWWCSGVIILRHAQKRQCLCILCTLIVCIHTPHKRQCL